MTPPASLDFYFDYVDPVSYAFQNRLRKMVNTGGIALRPLPFEINPPPNPLLDPEGEAFRGRWDAARREDPEVGIPTAPPWIVPWTRKAHELALHAREKDCFEEIHENLFRAYLIEGQDIGRVDVLVRIASAHGLDPRETKAVLDVDRQRDAVEEIRARGVVAGIRQPPVLDWNQKRLLGDAGLEALRTFLATGPESDNI